MLLSEELVKNSKIVLLHASTSMSFAVLFKKPAVFLTSNELEQSWIGPTIKDFAKLMNSQIINISDELNKPLDIERLSKIDEAKYKYYLGKDIQLIWQVGPYSNNIFEHIKNPNIKIYKFINDMGIAYSASDLIISRAGATAISEIISLGKASILIPYPYAADNHQEINARILEENNASLMLKEEQLKNGELEKIITNSSKFPLEIDNMKINAIKFSKKNSASLITEKIINEIDNAR